MNPVAVNSINIVKFGFSATFDILNREILFSITGLTEFNAGGDVAVAGVTFEIIDPSGVTVKSIDFGSPLIDPDVDPDGVFALPAGDGIFGSWKIKGAIKEADGTIYYATIPAKDICKPTGLEDDVVPGILAMKVNCSVPFIQVTEKTNLTYKGLSASTVEKNGVLYFPRGTVADVAFTSTPIQDNRLYTGQYVARLRTQATFDMLDNVYVKVAFDSTVSEDVTCKDKICDIACCLTDLYATYNANCNNAKGVAAKEKIDKVSLPLLVAHAKESCGKDATDEIKQIRKILDCDCNCTGQKIEGEPIQMGGGNSVVFTPSCAVEMGTPVVVGSTTTYPIKVKRVIIAKGDVDDDAWSIDLVETDCDKTYKITFNYYNFANTILTTIKNNIVLKDYLNTLIYNTPGYILSGLDGKCVIDLTECDYLLQEERLATNKIVLININSIAYNAPANLLVTNAAGILSWLNGLGKGTFTVTSVNVSGVVTLTIQSLNNTNIVNSIEFVEGTTLELVNFTADCASLKDILQAIIDYLCAITTSQIKLGVTIEFCTLDAGVKEIITYDPDVDLAQYLADENEARCKMIDAILVRTGFDCNTLKALMPFRPDVPFTDNDGIFMVKGGECSRVSPRDFMLYMLRMVNRDATLKEAFCLIDCMLPAGNCPDITDFVYTLGAIDDVPYISVNSVTYSGVQTLHQYITIKHRILGTSEWTVDTTTRECYANGILLSPYLITDLAEGVAYEVNIQVTPSASCNPSGVIKVITTTVESLTAGMTFINKFDDPAYHISSIKFGAGANILVGDLTPGEFINYDYSGLGAGPFVIKMTFTGITNPSKLFIAQMRGASTVQSAYFNYTTGELTVIAVITPVVGDAVFVRNTEEHYKIANYSVDEGPIASVCQLTGFTISRNAIAAADANANGDSVDVEVGWLASNGGSATDTVTFASSDTSKGGTHGNIGAGGCTYVTGTINSAV